MNRGQTRNIFFSLAIAAVAISVWCVYYNVRSVLNSPGHQQYFWQLYFTNLDETGAVNHLYTFSIWAPFVLIPAAIVLAIIGVVRLRSATKRGAASVEQWRQQQAANGQAAWSADAPTQQWPGQQGSGQQWPGQQPAGQQTGQQPWQQPGQPQPWQQPLGQQPQQSHAQQPIPETPTWPQQPHAPFGQQPGQAPEQGQTPGTPRG